MRNAGIHANSLLEVRRMYNAVGIDVSKVKSMVAIMRPFGEIVSTPFEIKLTYEKPYFR